MSAAGATLARPKAAPKAAPKAQAGAFGARHLVHAYYMVIVSTALLLAIGLIMTVSSHTVTALSGAKPESPYQQGLWQAAYIVAALGAAWIISRWPRKAWLPMACIAFIALLFIQTIVLFSGRAVGGNRAWLVVATIGGHEVTIQPSEFLKLSLALFLGFVLANKAAVLDRWVELIVPALLGTALAIGLVLLGKDLGTAAVMGLASLGTLIAAGVPWRKLFGIILPAVACAAGASLLYPRAHERWSVLLHPETASAAEGAWQIQQATYALAQGSVFGTGLGTSREKWGYLSQADSDFIFAVIGEELGLLGCAIVIILFGVLAVGLFQIVRLHPSRAAQVTTASIACWLAGQAVVNIAMVVKLLPVIGVPLPFVSSGGSALVSSVLAIGVVIGLLRKDPEVGPALRARAPVLSKAGTVAAFGRSRRPGR